jgi:hypothetical protein
VGRFIVANGESSMICPCHGSRYDIEGRVFRDANGVSTQPAPDDLGRYATSFDAAKGIIAITVPALRLHIDSISVHRQGANRQLRLKLVFPVAFGSTYEIYHHSDFNAPPQAINYSTTPAGLTDKSKVGPGASGNFTAYVDASGSRGFFSVGAVLANVL